MIVGHFRGHILVVISSIEVIQSKLLITDEFGLEIHLCNTNVFVEGLLKEDQESFEYHLKVILWSLRVPYDY